jgi:hypothetical protein
VQPPENCVQVYQIVWRCAANPRWRRRSFRHDAAICKFALSTRPFGRVAPARNNRNRAVVADGLPDLLVVVGFIGGDHQCWPWGPQNRLGGLTGMDQSARDDEIQRRAFPVNHRMEFCRTAAAADTDSLLSFPPFAPLAARCALTIVLSMECRPSRDFDSKRPTRTICSATDESSRTP